LGAQPLRLPAARIHQVGAADAFREAVVVLDPRPAGLALVVVDHQRLEARRRQENRAAPSGRAAAAPCSVVLPRRVTSSSLDGLVRRPSRLGPWPSSPGKARFLCYSSLPLRSFSRPRLPAAPPLSPAGPPGPSLR